MSFKDQPTDTISSIRFAKGSNTVFATIGWDCFIRVYDIEKSALIASKEVHAPLLTIDFFNENTMLVGGVDKTILAFNYESERFFSLNTLPAVIKSICVCQEEGIVAVGCWNETLYFLDFSDPGKIVKEMELPAKVFDMSYNDGNLVIALSDKSMALYTFADELLALRKTLLKSQIRCADISSDGSLAFGSVQGRVLYSHVEEATSLALSFAFRAHKSKNSVFPVNSVCFSHKNPTSVITAGSDGKVISWCTQSRSRIDKLYINSSKQNISSVRLSDDDKHLVIGVGPVYQTENPSSFVELVVIDVDETSLLPK
ncbi:hypothetical protein PCE1_004162 [Barthelona sp. PCE]